RLPGDEGRLVAGERRPRGCDLPHQLQRQLTDWMTNRLARFALCAATLTLLAATASAQQSTKPRSGKAASAAAAAPANPYPQRFATLCAACHGANGRSDMPATPALAGQHSFYAITQLF